jgi:hypothetical protein
VSGSPRLAALGLALLALAACSREPAPTPEAGDDDNTEVSEPAPPAPPPAPVVEVPPPPPPALELNLEEPAEEPIDESAQTMEDADATGLTTRALPGVEDEDLTGDDSVSSNSGD